MYPQDFTPSGPMLPPQPNTAWPPPTPQGPPPELTPGPKPEVASKRAIVKAAAISAAVALVLLVIAVLPAEYGVDPTGAGKVLGLQKLHETKSSDTASGSETPTNAPITDTPSIGSRHSSQPAVYKTDTVELTLKSRDSFEYKFNVDKDMPLLYSWTATGTLRHEFHGEPAAGPKGSYQSYEKANEQSSSGSLVAPFTGTHGWYWKNNTSKTVTITLTTSGYYNIVGIIGEQD